MSDETIPKFELRMREGATGPMTGANTELLMNGKKMDTVTKVKVEVEARGIAKITLEMFGQFKVVGNFEPGTIEKSPQGCGADMPDRGVRPDFRKELEYLINCHSKESGSNTPDFIIAEYLEDCLAAYDKAVTNRDIRTMPTPERAAAPKGPQEGT